MGALTIPAAGQVYLDTNPIIYSVEKHPVYWPLLQPLWQAAKGKTIEIVSGHPSSRNRRFFIFASFARTVTVKAFFLPPSKRVSLVRRSLPDPTCLWSLRK